MSPNDAPPPETKPVPVARYAELLAALHHYRDPPVSEILRAYGVEPAVFQVSEAHWTAELAQAEARGQSSLALRFATSYAKERRRIARAGLPLEALDRKPKQRDAGAAPGAPSEAPAAALPSYMQREAAEPVAAAPPAPVPPPPAPAPPAPVPPAPARVRGPTTGEISVAEMARPPMPFVHGAADPSMAMPSPSSPASADRGPRYGETADVDVSAIARRVLAFDPSKHPAPPPVLAPQQVGAAPQQVAPQQAASPQGQGSGPAPPRPPRPGYSWMIVRFDPETGEPLKEPLWREIPDKAPAR